MRSPGISRIPPGSLPRERMWKLSRQTPSAGWSAARDDPPRVVVVVDVAAPRERLVGDPHPARGRELGEPVQLRGGERVVVDRVGRDARADEHRVRAQLLHERRTCARRGAGCARAGPPAPPRSRGTAGRASMRSPSSSARRRTSARRERRADRGRSRTARPPSKPACAAASSFSSSVPLSETVAIERRTPPPLGRARELGEVAQHPLGVGPHAGEQLERARGLEHGHAAAVERAAAGVARGAQQLGLQRPVDDLGDPQVGAQQRRVERRARMVGHPGRRRVDRGRRRARGAPASSAAAAERRAARRSGRRAPRPARRPLVVGVDDGEVAGAERQGAVRDRRAGAARTEQHDVLGAARRRGRARSSAGTPASRCCGRPRGRRRRRPC